MPQDDIHPREARRRNLQPIFVAQELNLQANCPRTAKFSSPFGEIIGRYRISRWHRVGDYDGARHRECFCWLWLDTLIVGALHFNEYDFDWIANYDIYQAMDARSSDAEKLAYVLIEGWENFSADVAFYGSVLEFGGLWLRREFAKGAWWVPAAEHLIRRRKYALLVLHAFPLENEGRADQDDYSEADFQRRTRAMMRYYQRLLGVSRFPGPRGDDGWMWRLRHDLCDLIDPPGFFPLTDEFWR